jgi:peptidoglycan-N-acetylglucosamine deacetylase
VRAPARERRHRLLRTLVVAGAATLLACAAARGGSGEKPGELWAFTAPWDSLSDASLAANSSRLDVAVTGWIALDTISQQPRILYGDSLVRASTPRHLALVTSWFGDRFHPASVIALGKDRSRLAAIAGSTARLASERGYRGLVLDFEEHTAADLPLLLAVARAFTDSAHARGIAEVSMAIPATDTAAYPARALLASVDALIVMLYDQHWSGSEPGPVADPAWARTWLTVRAREVDASRLVAALPTYGYAWGQGKPAATVGYDAARAMTAAAGQRLTRDDASGWLHGRGSSGSEVWVSDAVVVGRLARDARASGVTRIALWRLGLEDPAIWPALSR